MTISVAVVAHVERLEMVNQLATQVDADYVTVDDGTLGVEGNHRKAWTHLTNQPGEWGVVLEDDAQPVPNFRNQLEQALDAAPTPVVSLYLGTTRPEWIQLPGDSSAQRLQPLIRTAVSEADTVGASFITAPALFHAVALAIRTDLIPSMLDATAQSDKPVDTAISAWCNTYGHTVAYTQPSLTDHVDGPTITTHPDGDPRTHARKAYRTGTRAAWTPKTVAIQ